MQQVSDIHTQRVLTYPVLSNQTCTVPIGKSKDRFLQTIHNIALTQHYDPNQILSLFTNYSSADFSRGSPPKLPSDSIPLTIWQSVCTHYNLSTYAPYTRRVVTPSTKSGVFISGKVTDRLVHSHLISEQFCSAQRLYQYLNWTLKMNTIAGTVVLMEGQNPMHSENTMYSVKVLLFDVELHDHRGQPLYALCVTNDAVHKAQWWQLADLLTASELADLLKIDSSFDSILPKGVRALSPQFQH